MLDKSHTFYLSICIEFTQNINFASTNIEINIYTYAKCI